MKRNTHIKSIIICAAVGALLRVSAIAGPPSYLYSQGSPLPYKATTNVARKSGRPFFHRQADNVPWHGVPRLFNAGQGVISLDEFDQ
jgi:hypothetical protein